MVNNNNSNFTKEDGEKDSAVHAFQSQDEDFGFKELYEQSLCFPPNIDHHSIRVNLNHFTGCDISVLYLIEALLV